MSFVPSDLIDIWLLWSLWWYRVGTDRGNRTRVWCCSLCMDLLIANSSLGLFFSRHDGDFVLLFLSSNIFLLVVQTIISHLLPWGIHLSAGELLRPITMIVRTCAFAMDLDPVKKQFYTMSSSTLPCHFMWNGFCSRSFLNSGCISRAICRPSSVNFTEILHAPAEQTNLKYCMQSFKVNSITSIAICWYASRGWWYLIKCTQSNKYIRSFQFQWDTY